MTKVFPFSASVDDGNVLFRAYVAANRDAISKKHGTRSFVGKTTDPLVWSYYEVDAEVLDLHTVEFTTFGMKSPVFGGRGDQQETFRVDYPGIELYLLVEKRKIQLAKEEHRRRKEKAKKEKYEKEVLAIYNEMFPLPLRAS